MLFAPCNFKMIVFLRRGPVYNGISCAPPRASIQHFAKPVSTPGNYLYGAPGAVRTRDPLLKRQVLIYQLSYRRIKVGGPGLPWAAAVPTTLACRLILAFGFRCYNHKHQLQVGRYTTRYNREERTRYARMVRISGFEPLTPALSAQCSTD